MRSLKFRSIGPAVMGGRVDDFAVVESDPRTYYVATAAGAFVRYRPDEHAPDPEREAVYAGAYQRYRDVYFALKPVFDA